MVFLIFEFPTKFRGGQRISADILQVFSLSFDLRYLGLLTRKETQDTRSSFARHEVYELEVALPDLPILFPGDVGS